MDSFLGLATSTVVMSFGLLQKSEQLELGELLPLLLLLIIIMSLGLLQGSEVWTDLLQSSEQLELDELLPLLLLYL